MLRVRVLLLWVCVSYLVVTTHASLLVALAALKGAFIGAGLKSKFILKGGGHDYGGYHGGYVNTGRQYHSVPYYAVLHYHSDHHTPQYAYASQEYHGSYGSYGGFQHKGHYVHRRSVNDAVNEEENILLTTVTQLDPDGCIPKLLCSLQTKDAEARTLLERTLASLFNSDKPRTSYNAAFVYAVGVGQKTTDPASCNKAFSKCPLEEQQLSSVLERAWGCELGVL